MHFGITEHSAWSPDRKLGYKITKSLLDSGQYTQYLKSGEIGIQSRNQTCSNRYTAQKVMTPTHTFYDFELTTYSVLGSLEIIKYYFSVYHCIFLTLFNPALFGPFNTQGVTDLPPSFFLSSWRESLAQKMGLELSSPKIFR